MFYIHYHCCLFSSGCACLLVWLSLLSVCCLAMAGKDSQHQMMPTKVAPKVMEKKVMKKVMKKKVMKKKVMVQWKKLGAMCAKGRL